MVYDFMYEDKELKPVNVDEVMKKQLIIGYIWKGDARKNLLVFTTAYGGKWYKIGNLSYKLDYVMDFNPETIYRCKNIKIIHAFDTFEEAFKWYLGINI